MADGDRIPSVRIAYPMLEDFGHLARNMRPDEIDQYLALSGMDEYVPDIAARFLASTPGYVWLMVDENNLPFLVGGLIPIRKGVYEAWLAGTMEGWAKHGLAITRFCRKQVDNVLKTDGHRVYVVALTGRHQAHAWYERGVGMKREGVLHGYFSNGADAVIFAKGNF
jgi:hypothetical protein